MYRDISSSKRASVKLKDKRLADGTRFASGARQALVAPCCMLVLGVAVTGAGVAGVAYGGSVDLHDLVFLGAAFICMGGICIIIAVIQVSLKCRVKSHQQNVYPDVTEGNEKEQLRTDNKTGNVGLNATHAQQPLPMRGILRKTTHSEESEMTYNMPGIETTHAHPVLDASQLYSRDQCNVDAPQPVVTLPAETNNHDINDNSNGAVYSVDVNNDVIPHR